MRVYVVGAAGFIGEALVRQLAAADARVTAVDLVAPRQVPEGVDVRILDLRREAIPFDAGVDVVYYLAQSPHYRAGGPQAIDLFRVNAAAAIQAYEAAADAGARCFIYASSGSVYANSFAPLHENAPVQRHGAYSLSKLIAEDWLRLSDRQLPATAVRLFGVYGPGQRDTLAGDLRRRVASGEPVTIERHPSEPDDVDGLRVSFCFLEDTVAALTTLARRLISGASLPQEINIAGPEPISIRRFAETTSRQLGVPVSFELTERARRGDLIADTTLMQETLGINWTPFDTGMQRWLE